LERIEVELEARDLGLQVIVLQHPLGEELVVHAADNLFAPLVEPADVAL